MNGQNKTSSTLPCSSGPYMYNLSLFFSFSSRMFEPTFSLFRHFVYLDLSRNLVPRSSHSLRLSRHFEYISILVGNFGHVILLCARVFSRAAAILKSEKTLGTRLYDVQFQKISLLAPQKVFLFCPPPPPKRFQLSFILCF